MWSAILRLFRPFGHAGEKSPLGIGEPTLDELVQIGLVTYQWASLEVLLDFANQAILKFVPEGDTLGAELPRALDRKLDLFERAHIELGFLAPLRPSALALVTEVRRLKDVRHDFVHGVASSKVGGTIKMRRLHLKGDAITGLYRTYSRKQRWKATREVAACAWGAVAHVEALLDLVRLAYRRH